MGWEGGMGGEGMRCGVHAIRRGEMGWGWDATRGWTARRRTEPLHERLSCFNLLACLGALPQGTPWMRDLCEAVAARREVEGREVELLKQKQKFTRTVEEL